MGYCCTGIDRLITYGVLSRYILRRSSQYLLFRQLSPRFCNRLCSWYVYVIVYCLRVTCCVVRFSIKSSPCHSAFTLSTQAVPVTSRLPPSSSSARLGGEGPPSAAGTEWKSFQKMRSYCRLLHHGTTVQQYSRPAVRVMWNRASHWL